MHNATLDHARLWAAFGIVLFHAGAPGASVGYAALPFFLIVLLMLGGPSAARLPFRAWARLRAQRLLGPWLLWSGVYGLLKLAEVLATGKAWGSEFAPFMLLTGPALHLWFLPFAFVASLALHPLAQLPLPGGRGMVAGLCGLGALAALGLAQGAALPAPLAQWREVLPATCLGFGLALLAARPAGRDHTGTRPDLAAGLGAMTAAGAALGLAALTLGWTGGLLQLALALLALLVCLARPRPATWWSDRAARCALGVYLAHPLVMSVLERTTPLPQASLALALATALGALGLTLALAAAPPLWPRGRTGKPAVLAAE